MSKRYWKVDDPLFESLPNYDKVRIQELLDALQRGQLDVKEELTLQLLALCKVILQKRLYKNPALQRSIADLIGVLMLRTCTWVDELCQQTVDCTPTPKYYCQIIKNEINNFNTDDTNPNVSGNWLRKQYHKGQTAPVRVKLREELLQVNPTLVLELEDVLLTLAETEREREIIVLRFQGYTESEIAEQLGITRQYVNQIRANLEERYDEYLQRESLT
jgi:RNA polymerase sigma factor (sigma-70 family)